VTSFAQAVIDVTKRPRGVEEGFIEMKTVTTVPVLPGSNLQNV
jgi:hypothetical protein